MENNYEEVPGLILKIRTIIDSMSKSERRVCEYISEHSEEVIHMCISDMAATCGVSEATVIRTSKKLGFPSYQNLKITLAQDIVTPIQAINEDIAISDPPTVIYEKVFNSIMHTINFTFKTLNVEDISLASDKLLAARRICICGLGNSHAIAQDMQHKFMRLGLDAVAYTDNHIQVIGTTFIRDTDVLVAISHSGSSRDVVHAAEIAKKNGAFVISITSMGRSPLHDIADLSLCTSSNETKYRALALSSRIAQMAIIDTIYTFIALRKENSTEGFFNIEKNLGDTKY